MRSAKSLYARVGKLLEIRHLHTGLEFSYQFCPSVDPIPLETIAELARDLDIDLPRGENYRRHWAVKDVDLFGVLKKHGLWVETNPVAPEVEEQLRDIRSTASHDAKPKVFIVHGRDEGIKNEVARWIARIGLDDVILHEQSNLGRALIMKFQQVAETAAFAIAIMTPDDVGGVAGGRQACRARQNVIFELGYFLGKLGPERVAALVADPDLEKPSDYDGVVYINYDRPGGWKLVLAREFESLGIPFDPSRAY
jgi:Predicted nucleotide-binding protein containing TIR-like domain